MHDTPFTYLLLTSQARARGAAQGRGRRVEHAAEAAPAGTGLASHGGRNQPYAQISVRRRGDPRRGGLRCTWELLGAEICWRYMPPRAARQGVMCMPFPAAPLGPLAAFELTCNALGNTSRVRACEMCSAFGLVCGRRSLLKVEQTDCGGSPLYFYPVGCRCSLTATAA